jgi:hypothetical protein
LALDVEYVRTWSVACDMRIIWETLKTVASRSGISQDGHATMPVLREPPAPPPSLEA